MKDRTFWVLSWLFFVSCIAVFVFDVYQTSAQDAAHTPNVKELQATIDVLRSSRTTDESNLVQLVVKLRETAEELNACKMKIAEKPEPSPEPR